MAQTTHNTLFSFVFPVFQEEETLPELFRRLAALWTAIERETPGCKLEAIFVDDGSRDQSATLLAEAHRREPRYKCLRLSRNFGHQTAISAGIAFASGDATIIMDADLQDPPEVVLEMIRKWKAGAEMVYAVRDRREGETWFKKTSARVFYRFLQSMTEMNIPADTGDFRLIDKKVREAFARLPERARFVRGMMSWVGFRQEFVTFTRLERFAGTTKYPLRKMLRLAADAILSFSQKPLRLALNLGLVVSGLSFVFSIWALWAKLSGHSVVPGWSSLLAVTGFLGGVQLMVIGILGQYIGRIYEEVQGRPLYLLTETIGFDRVPTTAHRSQLTDHSSPPTDYRTPEL